VRTAASRFRRLGVPPARYSTAKVITSLKPNFTVAPNEDSYLFWRSSQPFRVRSILTRFFDHICRNICLGFLSHVHSWGSVFPPQAPMRSAEEEFLPRLGVLPFPFESFSCSSFDFLPLPLKCHLFFFEGCSELHSQLCLVERTPCR